LQSAIDGCWSGRFCLVGLFVCLRVVVSLSGSHVSLPGWTAGHRSSANGIEHLRAWQGRLLHAAADRNRALECHWTERYQRAAVAESRCAVCMGGCGICGGHPRYLRSYGGVAAGDGSADARWPMWLGTDGVPAHTAQPMACRRCSSPQPPWRGRLQLFPSVPC
jgi:hypothetical protein